MRIFSDPSPVLHGYAIEVENLVEFAALLGAQEIDFLGAVAIFCR